MTRYFPFPLTLLAVTMALPVHAADIRLDVDLTGSARQLFHGHEIIPVQPGPLTLYYPKWIPGEHSPSGPLENLAGLKLSTGGKVLSWRRDPMDMYAIHLEVPQGASSLEADFDFLSPDKGGEFGQSVSATTDIVDLEWNQVLLYPAGRPSREIGFEPSVKLPAGWQFGTALETTSSSGQVTRFKPVTLNNLVDSPLIAGRYFSRLDLAPGDPVPVHLDVVGDTPEDLVVSLQELAGLRNLVQQAYLLFGGHHYGHYDFLFTLSSNTGHFGLEHHQSSDDRIFPDYFTDPAAQLAGAHLLPHEYVHSWNGKFRRPAGLWTSDFNTTPMQGDLLWVYEGLTEYLGDVLTARSGMLTAEQYRDTLAASAANMDHRPGREWRPLQDTTDEAQILYYAPREWQNWRRVQDFYSEGELVWLDVDTKIRELSGGKRTLDDFTHLFYGVDNGSYVTKTYTFDDLVAALKQVQDYDWAGFLHARLDETAAHAPLDGITRGGYELAYTDTPTEFFKDMQKVRKTVNLMYSIGLSLSGEEEHHGLIEDVLWDGPAYKAGLGPGMKLVAVNGRALDADPKVLEDAIQAAKDAKAPIELLVRDQDRYATYSVDYHGGLRYPVLKPLPGAVHTLDAITAPRH
ncbi:MAG TPA: M61 family peptidase [Gammaproteobacteria bacterium]|nr:M61 family peptidase [Gammaproteobacteria bacterium]